ncbi:hypothetical protein [Bacillus sp. CH_50]|uniref:hypothetical protein n=1 Tax=Bacillus sp. CH_50 TaxID=2978214 RepID=UPI0030FB0B24|nr:hypothetical protein [Bacillus cereus]
MTMRVTSNTIKISNESFKKSFKNTWFPGFSEMKTIVEDYAQMAIRRKDHWYSFMDLQILILQAMVKELQTLELLNVKKKTEEDLEFVQEYELITRTTLNALIQISNGIAFRFLDYNYSLMSLFQCNKTSVHAILEEGFQSTLELAANLTDLKGPSSQVLISDLNTITNIGDIIIKNEDEFEIVEVKKGRGRGARIRRQKERMESLTSFINESFGTVDNKEVEIVSLPPRKHRLIQLEDCLKESESKGVVEKKISDFLTIYGIDFEAIKEIDDHKTIEVLFKSINNRLNDPEYFSISSIEYRQLSGNGVPITVFPIDTKYIVDLLMGSKAYISVLNFEELERYIESKGWNAFNLVKEGVTSDQIEKNFYQIYILFDKENIEKNVSISIDTLTSIMMELMDVEEYLNSFRIMVAKDSNKNWIPFYEDESGIWR